MGIQYEHNSGIDRCAYITHQTDKKDSEKNYSLSLGDPFFANDISVWIEQPLQLDVVVIEDHHKNNCCVSADGWYIIFHDECGYGGKYILSDNL